MLRWIRGAWLLRSVLRDPPSCGGQAGRAGSAESSRSNGRARRPAPTGHFRLGGFEAVVEGAVVEAGDVFRVDPALDRGAEPVPTVAADRKRSRRHARLGKHE